MGRVGKGASHARIWRKSIYTPITHHVKEVCDMLRISTKVHQKHWKFEQKH